VDTSDQCLVHLPGYCCTELPKACNYEWDLWLGASSGSSGSAPPGVTLLPTSFLYNSLQTAKDARRPAIDVLNSGGGRCRTYRQHPQGARHRCIQLQWWPLPDLSLAPPREPTIDVSNSGGGRCWTCRQHPPGGPPLTSPTLEVATAGPVASTLRGPAIDISNFSGHHCRTCHRHPQGARNRRLQLRWWSPPRGHPRLQLPDLQLRHLPGARHQCVS
jgi:hypothetical protein